ncbi:YybS family protein [Alkalihalobacillus trypoxylicola]|uniref:DUF2232 domain-containing protein n=1 Tax=Alkalihalobacillus trypoxylicola TaxID=519424 RepID=A0A161PJY9_9BACI|nr:YybS family protein [Alkalihalobacillus trypoxylicola]KYG29631.1 hypothetical protein AZF04_08965 [Alkalihalobacillus trypoxylicola]
MNQTRLMVEGAMIAALFIVIYLVTTIVPFAFILTLWFLPTPFIVYGIRTSLKANLLVWFVSCILAFIFGGLSGLLLALFFATSGVVMGELYRRKKGSFSVLIGASLSFTVGMLGLYVATFFIMGENPMSFIKESLREQINVSEAMLSSIGQNTDNLQPFYEMIDTIHYFAPLMLVVMGCTIAVITVIVNQAILKRLRIPFEKLPAFRDWRFPRFFIWYYLITMLLLLIGFEEGSTLFLFVTNLYPLFGFVMIIQGLSFIFYYFHIKKQSIALPILILIVSFLTPLSEIVRILGIIDLGFDLRSYVTKKNK